MTIKTNKPSEHHVLTTIMKIQRARLNAGTTPFADNLTDTVEGMKCTSRILSSSRICKFFLINDFNILRSAGIDSR